METVLVTGGAGLASIFTRQMILDISKAKRELEWRHLENMSDGLQKLVGFFSGRGR